MRIRPTTIRPLDREMTQAWLLGQEIQPASMRYPPVVGAAIRTTYGLHYKALLEFLHNGRKELLARAHDPLPPAVLVRHLLPGVTELGIRANRYEKQRFLGRERRKSFGSRLPTITVGAAVCSPQHCSPGAHSLAAIWKLPGSLVLMIAMAASMIDRRLPAECREQIPGETA